MFSYNLIEGMYEDGVSQRLYIFFIISFLRQKWDLKTLKQKGQVFYEIYP